LRARATAFGTRIRAAVSPDDRVSALASTDEHGKLDPISAHTREQWLVEESGTETPAKVLLKAAEIRFALSRYMEFEERVNFRRALILVLETAIVGLEAGRNRSESRNLLPLAYTFCGFCFDDSGQLADAARCFDEALRLDPNNDAVLTARGILFYGRDSTRAAADFYEAVALQPQIAWPYLFLAHYYVTHGRYEACLAMCEQALRFPSTDRARANSYEWMAISQAMLGFERQTVRSSFQQARRLAPENERIRRNEAALERSPRQPSDRIIWETGDDREITEMAKLEFRPAFGLAA
jgi:tetratricopeptide (TPR) repeat protein